ncbi:MAG: hypothetical protein NTY99_00235 [DPANN group archaeon]|nr:hypothetical protein [DPANN group archaeon]
MNTPEFVTRWKEVFYAVEHGKVNGDLKLGFFADVLGYGLQTNTSHAILLDKGWEIAYCLPAETRVEITKDKAFVFIEQVKAGIRYRDEGFRTDTYELPPDVDISKKVINYINRQKNLQLFPRRYRGKANTEVITSVLEDSKLVRMLEKKYSEFIEEAEEELRPPAMWPVE